MRTIIRLTIVSILLSTIIPTSLTAKKKRVSTYDILKHEFNLQAKELCLALSPKGMDLLKPIVLKYKDFDRDAVYKAYEKANPATPQKRYPKEKLVKLKLRAEEVFKPIEIGDEITVQSRKYVYKGKFGGIAKGKMKIGDRYAPLVDLSQHWVDRTKPELMAHRKMEFLQREYYTPKKEYEIAYKTERHDFYKAKVKTYFDEKLAFVKQEINKLRKEYPSVRHMDVADVLDIDDPVEANAVTQLIADAVYKQQPLKKDLKTVITEEMKKIADNNNDFAFYQNKFVTKEVYEKRRKEEAAREAREKKLKEEKERLARERAEQQRLKRLQQEKLDREQAAKERDQKRRETKQLIQRQKDQVMYLMSDWKSFCNKLEDHKKQQAKKTVNEPEFKNTKKQSGPDALGLFCVSADGKRFGFADAKGETVIPEKFEEAAAFQFHFPFTTPVAIVKSDGKYGILKVKTEEKLLGLTYKDYYIIQPKYDKIDFLTTETVPCPLLKVYSDGKCSAVNIRDEQKAPGPYDDISLFRPGILMVRNGKKLGLVQTDGKELLKPDYEKIEIIKPNADAENTETVEDILAIDTAYAKIYKDGKIGFIDAYGHVLVAPKFRAIMPFSQKGYALASDDTKWGVVDKYGYYLVDPTFTEKSIFFPGKSNGAKEKINVFGVSEGLLRTWDETDGSFKFYDMDGNVAFSLKSSFVSGFGQGLALFLDEQTKKYGFIDRNGKVVLKPVYEDAFPFSDGLAAVSVGGKWGNIDKAGALVINPTFAAPLRFENGKAKLDADGKEITVDKTGKTINESK